MEFLKTTYAKYREIIMYLIFGALTTAVNYFSYIALSSLFLWQSTFPPTSISWAIAVIFAYLTNRVWVFGSKATGFGPVSREFAAFVGARLASGALDVVIMFVFVDIVGMNDLVIKLLSNIAVIILNYIFSKLFVFRNTDLPRK